ncbi:M57 family metalloprotease [Flavobacterium sp. ZB4P13]|uniref:M57 family metalloprotease n=1 Tax=Flavobacterium sp. ZB4P13 TaxID=3401728 RepID=UPI003AB0EFC5
MKKKLTKIMNILIVCSFLIFVQCSNDGNIDSSTNVNTLNIDEIIQLRNFISSSIGTDLEKVSFDSMTNNFTIGGDIRMSLVDARQHYSKSIKNKTSQTNKIAQQKYIYAMTPANAASVQVYISPSVNSDWRIAINQAITNWNITNSGISIILVNASTSTSIDISTYTDTTTNTIAYANFPNSIGQSGKYIKINTQFNTLTANNKIQAMTHEMGHNFGLTHTDQATYTQIPCTPVLDSGSIMNSTVSDLTNFSLYDNVAISILYPIFAETKKLYGGSVRYKDYCTTNPCDFSQLFNIDQLGYLYTTNVSGTIPLYRRGENYAVYTLTSDPVNNTFLGYIFSTQQPGTIPLYSFKYINYDNIIYRNENKIVYHRYYTINLNGMGVSNYEKIVGYVASK